MKIKNHCWYIKYEYINEFAYLSESMSNFILLNPKNIDNELAVSLFFRTYNNGVDNSKRRPEGNGIFFNTLFQGLIKNRYHEEFWDNKEYLIFDINIFDSLLNIKSTLKNESNRSGNTPQALSYKYYFQKIKF